MDYEPRIWVAMETYLLWLVKINGQLSAEIKAMNLFLKRMEQIEMRCEPPLDSMHGLNSWTHLVLRVTKDVMTLSLNGVHVCKQISPLLKRLARASRMSMLRVYRTMTRLILSIPSLSIKILNRKSLLKNFTKEKGKDFSF